MKNIGIKKLIKMFILVASTVILDQLIKLVVIKYLYNSSIVIISNLLNLTYIENTGGAFGIGSNNILFFIIVNIVIISLVIRFIISGKNEINDLVLISLGLIISGGIGNLIDRIFRGFVIDYIDINPWVKYPIFNFADICIFIGCIIIIINLIINVIKERKK